MDREQTTQKIAESEATGARKRQALVEELLDEQRHFRLVVSGAQGVTFHDLPQAGKVTIGRTTENDIAIEDASISRNHAALYMEEPMRFEDLGSTNGTRIDGEALESHCPRELACDQPVDLGDILVVIQQHVRAERPRRVVSHAYFEVRLEEECLRAQENKSPFSLLRVRLEKDVPEEFCAVLLAGCLRPIDLMATYAPGEFELILPNHQEERAQALAATIDSALKDRNIQADIQAATYPQDGQSAEALQDALASGLKGEARAEPGPGEYIVEDPAMKRIYKLLKRVAKSKLGILLLGETGTGKEVLAESVHRLSDRGDECYLQINCAAISGTLLESELFGHEKGAFTGAVQTKKGLLEEADGGTVFLDEIGEMPLDMQVKLLRVLEAGEVTRVGGLKPHKVDVRFVAATNRDLEAEINKGTFRADLFYRLNGMSFYIPPLRQRQSELKALAKFFLQRSTGYCKSKTKPVFSEKALELMRAYTWPGNIRELRNMVERAALLCEGAAIEVEDLPYEKMGSTLSVPSLSAYAGPPEVSAPPANTQPEAFASEETRPSTDLRAKVREFETQQILDALKQTGGNQTQAAKLLGIARRTFIKRLEAYGIARPRKDAEDED